MTPSSPSSKTPAPTFFLRVAEVKANDPSGFISTLKIPNVTTGTYAELPVYGKGVRDADRSHLVWVETVAKVDGVFRSQLTCFDAPLPL